MMCALMYDHTTVALKKSRQLLLFLPIKGTLSRTLVCYQKMNLLSTNTLSLVAKYLEKNG